MREDGLERGWRRSAAGWPTQLLRPSTMPRKVRSVRFLSSGRAPKGCSAQCAPPSLPSVAYWWFGLRDFCSSLRSVELSITRASESGPRCPSATSGRSNIARRIPPGPTSGSPSCTPNIIAKSRYQDFRCLDALSPAPTKAHMQGRQGRNQFAPNRTMERNILGTSDRTLRQRRYPCTPARGYIRRATRTERKDLHRHCFDLRYKESSLRLDHRVRPGHTH